MENQYINYDAVCYSTFINIQALSAKAKTISFKNFDYKNKEHRYILAVTMACWSILGEKDVAIDGNFFTRYCLSKKYKKICKISNTNKIQETKIDVPELLEYLRDYAVSLCGKDFNFGDIYDAYYNEKE